jgi:hypothetical protein
LIVTEEKFRSANNFKAADKNSFCRVSPLSDLCVPGARFRGSDSSVVGPSLIEVCRCWRIAALALADDNRDAALIATPAFEITTLFQQLEALFCSAAHRRIAVGNFQSSGWNKKTL